MGGPIAAMALNQPQMKNGPVLRSPTPSNAGSWFGRCNAAAECEVDLALMAKSDEWAQTLDFGRTWLVREVCLAGGADACGQRAERRNGA